MMKRSYVAFVPAAGAIIALSVATPRPGNADANTVGGGGGGIGPDAGLC